MRFRAVLSLLLVCAACSAPRRGATTEPRTERLVSKPLFRYVNLGPFGEFELGKPFGRYARLATAEGSNRYRLRDEAFGGAESIVVTTDDGGMVRRIRFEYGPAYPWATMRADYLASLGEPSTASENRVVWNDGRTEFSLSRAPGTSYAERAEMRDLTSSS